MLSVRFLDAILICRYLRRQASLELCFEHQVAPGEFCSFLASEVPETVLYGIGIGRIRHRRIDNPASERMFEKWETSNKDLLAGPGGTVCGMRGVGTL